MASTQLEIGLRCGVSDTHREVLKGFLSNVVAAHIRVASIIYYKANIWISIKKKLNDELWLFVKCGGCSYKKFLALAI